MRKCICFLFCTEKDVHERLVCDVCTMQHEEVLRYCYVCEQYTCSECYTIHQRFNSSRNHKTSRGKCLRLDEIPLSRKDLVEDSLKEVMALWPWHTHIVYMKNARTLRYCDSTIIENKIQAFITNPEGGEPFYVLWEIMDISHLTDDAQSVPIFNTKSGFLFIICSTNVIYFIKAHVPYLEKLLNFSKIISRNYAGIMYLLRACSTPFKTITIENVHKDLLCTEFNNKIAVLGLENNKKFGLVPAWSINYFSYEGKVLHKCYLKNSNKGIILQSPTYMRATFNNTIVICDSVQTDKYVNEFDTEGNLVLKVNLKEEITGMITSVTSDDENNIYVSSKHKVIQISENGRKVRQMLTVAESLEYDRILDICFSAKTRKFHVVMSKKDHTELLKIILVSFRFKAY
ncbi:uncharacterized protein LOC128551101 [Mercenaria mercenaria]|uniref:uncharacterized protein LOC128551101 n=1 Tax=Mercenaria mercenaria TaxID=6596 RepID=UPI00234F1E45|nr:uncharacterized protein LOC128551101 [Mercenaria mercenaria]